MKVFFIAICILFPALCVAQSSAAHKIYSGPFLQEHTNGKAEYSYLNSGSGERIFDGPFKYHSGFESLEGNFKNNRQIGKWVRTRPNNVSGPKALIKTVTTINFGENGYLDGHFKIQEFYRNGTVIDILDATYRNGRLNGSFKGKIKEGTFSGQYKDDVPVGMWKYSWLDAPVDFDKTDGYGRVPVKYINPTTGDIREEFQDMPTYPDYLSRPRGWWTESLEMRDSRLIAFNPLLNAEMDKHLHNGRYVWEGKRVRGFEDIEEVSYLLEFDIPDGLLNSYNDGLRGNWSVWDDFILLNCELTVEEIGDSPVTVNLLIDVDGEGNISLIEKDDAVSDKLNEETLRLLRKLHWAFGKGFGDIEEKARAGLRAYCNIEVKFDPVKMKSNLDIFNERKRKKQESLEAKKRYEESFAPIADVIQDKKPEAEDKIYDRPDEMPQFPGGQAGLAQYLHQTLHYPASAADNFIQGKVIVGFIVRKDGTVSDVKILKGRSSDLDKEAMRVVKAMPKFKPGKVNGEPVNVSFSIPINFSLGN